MKKGFSLIELLVVIAIVGILFSGMYYSFSGIKEKLNKNYRVEYNNQSYYVESYTKENNGQCVYLSEEEIRLCGDWSVEKLNIDR